MLRGGKMETLAIQAFLAFGFWLSQWKEKQLGNGVQD